MKVDIRATHIIAMAILVIALSVGVTIAQNFSVPSGTPGNADGNFGGNCPTGQYVSSVTLSGGVVCKALPTPAATVAGAPQWVLLWESASAVTPSHIDGLGTSFNLNDNINNYKTLVFAAGDYSRGYSRVGERYKWNAIPVSRIPTTRDVRIVLGGDDEENIVDGDALIWRDSSSPNRVILLESVGSQTRGWDRHPGIYQIWGIK